MPRLREVILLGMEDEASIFGGLLDATTKKGWIPTRFYADKKIFRKAELPDSRPPLPPQ